MTVQARLESWRNAGAITSPQHDVLVALTRREPFSLFVEINALLYLGVVSFAAGVAWTVTTYSARFGDTAILSTLTAAFAAAVYYCFTHARPYNRHEVEHPGAFDYVLYLGCLIFAVELGYIEARFHPFGADWDHTLLVAASVFFALAYRFDNRLVLSLGLSTLGAWFGVRVSHFGLRFERSLRVPALIYGGLVAATGTTLYRAGIKRHFFETYLHVAAHVSFIALVSGSSQWNGGAASVAYLGALLGLAALAIWQGTVRGRFVFVVYGAVYAYAGVSGRVLPSLSGDRVLFAYFAITATLMVVALVMLSRRFGRDE